MSALFHPLTLVCFGGGCGAAARYILSRWITSQFAPPIFPLGTCVVNVLGCLVAGLLLGATERFNSFSPEAKLFLFTGVLGGFTTFSAFGLEAMTLVRKGAVSLAIIYAAVSITIGIAAVFAGFELTRPR